MCFGPFLSLIGAYSNKLGLVEDIPTAPQIFPKTTVFSRHKSCLLWPHRPFLGQAPILVNFALQDTPWGAVLQLLLLPISLSSYRHWYFSLLQAWSVIRKSVSRAAFYTSVVLYPRMC
jgi:hypothetical protein